MTADVRRLGKSLFQSYHVSGHLFVNLGTYTRIQPCISADVYTFFTDFSMPMAAH